MDNLSTLTAGSASEFAGGSHPFTCLEKLQYHTLRCREMSRKLWTNQILDAVKEIADETCQKEVWLKANTIKESSYEELICTLFDDLNLQLFLDETENKTDPFYLELSELMEKINIFIDENPEISTENLLVNQQWKDIQIFAKQIMGH